MPNTSKAEEKLHAQQPINCQKPQDITENFIIRAGKERSVAKTLLITDDLRIPDSKMVDGFGFLPVYRAGDVSEPAKSEVSYFHHDIIPMLSPMNYKKQQFNSWYNGNVAVPTGHITVQAKNMEEAKDIVDDTEDHLFINLIQASLTEKDSQLRKIKTSDFFNKDTATLLSNGFASVEINNLIVKHMLLRPTTFMKLYSSTINHNTDIAYSFIFDSWENSIRFNQKNTIGTIWSAKVLVSDLMPKNLIIFAASPEYFGVRPIRVPLYHCVKDIYIQESSMAIMDAKTMSGIELI